jgi:hypothetical protein
LFWEWVSTPNVATHRCRANCVQFETGASSRHSVQSIGVRPLLDEHAR